jgi:hypothetical protein
MDLDAHVPERTTTQLILALMELARMERQIRVLRARLDEDDDRAQLRALEECRDTLLRIATRGMDDPKVPS